MPDFTHIANPVKVRAQVIYDIEEPTSETGFVAILTDGSRFALGSGHIARYAPVPGDYLVTQEDGYTYVNPKDVFERKYSPIEEKNV
jgi:hypothetical protein